MVKKIFLILFILAAVLSTANAASLSLSLNSLEAISEGDTVTLTATVSAVGDSVGNVSLQLGALPVGTATSDSLVQSIGSLSSGQSSSKSWTIRGDVANNYTFNVTASGTSVSDTFQNASLLVNTAAFIEVSDKTCSATTASVGNTITMNFIVRNAGGSPATVTINMGGYSSNFTLTSGSASSSFTLSAGSQSSKSYVFTATIAGSPTITAAITSTKNDPADQTCSVTIPSSTTTSSSNTSQNTGVSVVVCSTDSNCSDNNPCTIDSCTSNSCTHVNEVNGTSCEIGKICSTGECILNPANVNQGNNVPVTEGDTNKKADGNNSIGINNQNQGGNIPLDPVLIIVIVVILVIVGGVLYFTLLKKP